MESVLRKIFENKIDDIVHDEFLKFSRGNYENKYLIEAKRQKTKTVIKTGPEFANFFVHKCLDKVEGEIKVSGAIIGTLDIKGEIGFEIDRVKQFMGVKQYLVNCSVDKSKIEELMAKYPRMFYALSFSVNDEKLKIKAKAPKSAKPSSKGDAGPKVDFCSLATNDPAIISDLLFDVPEFKEVKIKHTIAIDNVILPEGETDPVKIRAMAKKSGKIIRMINVDGKEEKKEIEFVA